MNHQGLNRTGLRAGSICIALLICTYLSAAQAEKWRFSGVDRIVAVSDVHGAYDALVETLQEAEVIDDDLSWSTGKTHFVITGDLLDRGPDSRQVMDLVIRLEHEALLAGGRVHQLLGNHEVMNLIGDLRYVADEEYAAFLDMETPEDREFWFRHYKRSRPVDSDEAAVRWEFDEKAPPGFFGQRRAFRSDGDYGKWLLDKPFMVVINDTVFVHGGLPPYAARYGLIGTNASLKKALRGYVAEREYLQSRLVLGPTDRFKAVPQLLVTKPKLGQPRSKALVSAQNVVNLGNSPLHGSEGPTWYRGTAACNSLLEGDRLSAALDKLDATRVVVGHTTTVTRRVQQRMNGRVVEIDTGMLKENYGGSGNALIIEGDKLSVVNQDGESDSVPIEHPLRVGHESLALTDDDMAGILESGEITATKVDRTAWMLVQVSAGDTTVSAYFSQLPQQEGFVPELAAYKLDRLLGLGMVPVTVRREVNGHQGILQFVPTDTMTERDRVAAGAGKSAPCALDRQWRAMYIFDTLIRNRARTPSSMLYSPDDWYLMLVDHGDAFDAETDWPSYLREVDLAIGEQWRIALLELDNDVLQEELGGVLDEQRLAALVQRRDALIRISIGTQP